MAIALQQVEALLGQSNESCEILIVSDSQVTLTGLRNVLESFLAFSRASLSWPLADRTNDLPSDPAFRGTDKWDGREEAATGVTETRSGTRLMEVEATTLPLMEVEATTLLKESQASPAVLAGLHIFDP
jgi:hypothetical protein